MADSILNGGIAENVYVTTSAGKSTASTSNLADSIKNGIKNVVKSALFLETLRNINWSRGYCWYCELDGVPSPFHRGGVLGLPVKHVGFKIAEGSTFSFKTSSVDALEVPQSMAHLGDITIDMFDDEQMTLARFFERWYNMVYNPYKGVLPLTEACKQLTIYKQKSTRRNVKRVYYNIDENPNAISRAFSYITKGGVPKTTEGFDFLVFPKGPLLYDWNTDANDLNTLQVSLTVAHFVNQDFGDPTVKTGITELFGNTSGVIHDGTSFWDKLSNFI